MFLKTKLKFFQHFFNYLIKYASITPKIKQITQPSKAFICGIGNAVTDVLLTLDEQELHKILKTYNITENTMNMVDLLTIEQIINMHPKYTIEPGGSIANSISFLNDAGFRSIFIGVVGVDNFGSAYKSKMQNGFSISSIQEVKSSVSLILINNLNGQRTMLTYIDQNNYIDFDQIALDTIEVAVKSKYFLVEGYLFYNSQNITALHNLSTILLEAGIEIFLSLSDPICVSTNSKEIIAYITKYSPNIVCNNDEFNELEKIFDIKHYAKLIIVTNGKNGSKIYNNNSVTEYPAFNSVNNPIDTTGAGDVFLGSFVASLCLNYNYEKCSKVANLNAFEVINQLGTKLPKNKINLLN